MQLNLLTDVEPVERSHDEPLPGQIKPFLDKEQSEPEPETATALFSPGQTVVARDGAAFAGQQCVVVRLGKSLGCDRVFARPLKYPGVHPFPYRAEELEPVQAEMPEEVDCWVEWKHWAKGNVWRYTGCMGSPGMKPRYNGVMFPANLADGSAFDPNLYPVGVGRFALSPMIKNNVPLTVKR